MATEMPQPVMRGRMYVENGVPVWRGKWALTAKALDDGDTSPFFYRRTKPKPVRGAAASTIELPCPGVFSGYFKLRQDPIPKSSDDAADAAKAAPRFIKLEERSLELIFTPVVDDASGMSVHSAGNDVQNQHSASHVTPRPGTKPGALAMRLQKQLAEEQAAAAAMAEVGGTVAKIVPAGASGGVALATGAKDASVAGTTTRCSTWSCRGTGSNRFGTFDVRGTFELKHSGGDSSGTGGAAPAGAGGDGNCHVEAGSEVDEVDGTSDGVGYGILELRKVYRPRGAATARHVVGAGSAAGSDIRQARQRRAPARLRTNSYDANATSERGARPNAGARSRRGSAADDLSPPQLQSRFCAAALTLMRRLMQRPGAERVLLKKRGRSANGEQSSMPDESPSDLCTIERLLGRSHYKHVDEFSTDVRRVLERGAQDAEAEDEAAGHVDSGTNAPNELISWFEQNIGALVAAETTDGSGDGGRGRGRGRGGRGSGGGRGGRGAGGRGKASAARARQTQDTSSESGTHESSHMPPRGRRVSAAAAAAAAAADANCVLLSHEELSTIKNELEGMREQMEHARDAVIQHQKELERQAQQRQTQRELQRRRQACLLPSANSSGTQLTEQAGARVPHFGMEQRVELANQLNNLPAEALKEVESILMGRVSAAQQAALASGGDSDASNAPAQQVDIDITSLDHTSLHELAHVVSKWSGPCGAGGRRSKRRRH